VVDDQGSVEDNQMTLSRSSDSETPQQSQSVSSGVRVASLLGACPHCSGPYSAIFHGGPCPRIRAIEYHPDGTVKRVEFDVGLSGGSDV
jgi:hypothetical protein